LESQFQGGQRCVFDGDRPPPSGAWIIPQQWRGLAGQSDFRIDLRAALLKIKRTQ
jgi:hypothetical protein